MDINIKFIYCKYKKLIIEMKFLKEKLFRNTKLKSIKLVEWKNRFHILNNENDTRTLELVTEFLNANINVIKTPPKKIKLNNTPILICVIKNDYEKLVRFLEYYRELGIKIFVFVDNGSDDGTREFLCEQEDVYCLSTLDEYSSARRVAWINRAIAMFGDEKWYLVVDSDEFLSYIGQEEKRIDAIIKKANLEKYSRIEGFMLDMYSEDKLFQLDMSNKFMEQYSFFDTNSYKLSYSELGLCIRGGPRKRVFNHDLLLSKYPLFYFTKDDIVASSHFMRVSSRSKNAPIWFAIRHYKFTSQTDYEKILDAVQTEKYAQNSADYKKYLQKIKANNNIGFYTENYATKYINSKSLKAIDFLEEPLV